MIRTSAVDLLAASLAAIFQSDPAPARAISYVVNVGSDRNVYGEDEGQHSAVTCSLGIGKGLGRDTTVFLPDTSNLESTNSQSGQSPSVSTALAAMLPDDLRYEIYQSALGLVLRGGQRGLVHQQLLKGDIFLTVVNDEEWDGSDYVGAMRIPALVS